MGLPGRYAPHMNPAWTLKSLCDAYEALQRAKTCDELRVEMTKFRSGAGELLRSAAASLGAAVSLEDEGALCAVAPLFGTKVGDEGGTGSL